MKKITILFALIATTSCTKEIAPETRKAIQSKDAIMIQTYDVWNRIIETVEGDGAILTVKGNNIHHACVVFNGNKGDEYLVTFQGFNIKESRSQLPKDGITMRTFYVRN